METNNSPNDGGAVSWQELMHGMVIGAVRGMAEAHAQLSVSARGEIQPLSEFTMFQAAEVLTAMLLEVSDDCAEAEGCPEAAANVGRHVLSHLQAFRAQRERTGQPALFRVLERAGLDRHSSQ